MSNFLNNIGHAIANYYYYLIDLITFQVNWYENYFYGLVVLSLIVWALENLFPWRKNQKAVRKDFWLDAFYMFFNFFIFKIVFEGILAIINPATDQIPDISLLAQNTSETGEVTGSTSWWLILIIFFVLNDFVQWFTHVLLHRFDFLWQFHKVHHSVEEMGFAAHLRYHWMENIFYHPLKTLVVMLVVGAQPHQAFIVHFTAITIGHLNHANIRITWGPLKYIFNNSVMHLYHHAKELPEEQMPGVNFGISLSIWDYIFKTNYIPQDQEGSYNLGFDDIDEFPKGFFGQFIYGFSSKKKNN